MENKQIKIKTFVEEYNKRVSQLQETYLKDNLVITPYVSFVMKDVLAQKLVDATTYKYEDYIKEDGNTGRRKTNVVHVNSVAEYLLFCRLVIENYTNLTVETEGFFEEYDLLKQSGLLDKLMVGTETVPPMIPISELSELRSICQMKKDDALANYANPQSFISGQVERFAMLSGVVLKPTLDKIATYLENMDDKDIEKLVNKFEKVIRRI